MSNFSKPISQLAAFASLCLLSACADKQTSTKSEAMSEADMAKLTECHQILDEYKEYWTEADGYTPAQRDSMLLKIGPDSLRSFIMMLVDGEMNQEE